MSYVDIHNLSHCLRYIPIEELSISHREMIKWWEEVNNDIGSNFNGFGFMVENIYNKSQ